MARPADACVGSQPAEALRFAFFLVADMGR